MILVSSSRWKSLCLALGLLSVCASANDMESTKHSLRGGEPEISRLLTGGGGVTIDFEEYGLKRGDYVTNQYEPDYGLTFSSQGGCGNAPRIFDTNNPVTGEYGDSDLGTPNKSCWGGGPGWGKGGEKGQRGENCKKLDNVLIVQECNKDMSVPDDNADGGKIILNFDPPAEYVYDMGFLDNDYGGKLYIEYGNGATKWITLPELGDNAYEEADINLSNVRRITFELTRSGALVFIRFQPGRRNDIINIPFNTITVTDLDTCFDPAAWCEMQVFDIIMGSLDQDDALTPEEFDTLLNGLQALYCDAAAAAVADAESEAVIKGRGFFKLSRIGGSVEQIDLIVDMTTSAFAMAVVAAYADADADASAYAFASEQDCSQYQSNALKFRLCALAKGQAQSDALAEARAYASASTTASASTSTNVNVKVDADRINEFDAQVSAGASNFVVADANAAAEAFASAYAQALAKIKVSAKISEYHCCRHKSRQRTKVCRYKNKCKWHYDWKCSGQCGWWTTVFSEKFFLKVESISRDVERSFASALAESLAYVDVSVSMRAYFKDNLGSPNDTIFFKTTDKSLEIDATTQCYVR